MLRTRTFFNTGDRIWTGYAEFMSSHDWIGWDLHPTWNTSLISLACISYALLRRLFVTKSRLLCVYLLRHYPTSILCLQGLCRRSPDYPLSSHPGSAHSEPNTAGRSRSVLNRIILAAKRGIQMGVRKHSFRKRRAQDLHLQSFYSQRFSRPLPHYPDTRQTG